MAMSRHAINGRIGIRTRLSRTTKAERRQQAARGQDGLLAKLAQEIDPDGRMSEEDRTEAANQARRAHMNRLAKASAEARSRSRKKDRVPQEPEPTESTPETVEDLPDVTRPQIRRTDAA